MVSASGLILMMGVIGGLFPELDDGSEVSINFHFLEAAITFVKFSGKEPVF